ncbi:MAG: hypothetical protein OER93_01365 [Thermoleophilia bacterium]|nr:hypothetical protein [Thermoleophilia bacterium]
MSSMRDAEFNPNELQKALLGYDPTPLETALIDWTKANWAMAARGQVYARKEAEETISGVRGIHTDEGKQVLQIATRISIAERELVCRAIAAVLPEFLAETYGLLPKDITPPSEG